ncbi:MAG: type II toxin-antitoxin system VapC family toxin [Thermoleophilia bacterium]
MIVFDTHAWVWWADGDHRLSQRVSDRLLTDEMGVSAMSCFEVAQLARLGKLGLATTPEAWIGRALALPGVRLIPVDDRIAVAAAMLGGGFYGDPADRVIYATARVIGAPLATKDRKMRRFDPALTLW